jgi:hypothetical protein
MPPPDELDLSHTEEAKLSALADGSLDPAERESVNAWIAGDSRLRKRYEQQRAVVDRIRQATAQSQAPAALRAQIEADRSARRNRPRVAVWGTAGLAGSAAVAAVVLGLTLPGGTPAAPSVSQAASLALRGPSAPAPAPDPHYPNVKLARDVQDVYFPNWSGSFGWRAVGQRVDRLGQRTAVTVYYARGKSWLAYTIVGAGVLPQAGGQVSSLAGYELHTLSSGGRTIVTWRRDDHTCVLSARGVPAPILRHLAAWRPSGVTE